MNKDKKKITDIKEKILNKLEGELEITKVERVDFDEGLDIYCEFMNKGIVGNFCFNFIGAEYGVTDFNYEGADGDDLRGKITEWVEENVEFSMSLKYNGKEVM